LEIKKEESHTDSGSEQEAPAPKVKKVKPAAPTVAPTAAPAPAAPTPEAPAAPLKRGKFAKGSEEAKKYMADLRARQKSKKPTDEAADA
jgi:hypothetical protein